ncbi:MAG: hypothetical protein Q4C47_07515, partial [Planctomycetia bacterium]|nr:hypothetical protein [Planctomycetia bacterium]
STPPRRLDRVGLSGSTGLHVRSGPSFPSRYYGVPVPVTLRFFPGTARYRDDDFPGTMDAPAPVHPERRRTASGSASRDGGSVGPFFGNSETTTSQIGREGDRGRPETGYRTGHS